MSAPNREYADEDRQPCYGKGIFMCRGCGFPDWLCICRPKWGDVVEDREDGYPDSHGNYYEDS